MKLSSLVPWLVSMAGVALSACPVSPPSACSGTATQVMSFQDSTCVWQPASLYPDQASLRVEESESGIHWIWSYAVGDVCTEEPMQAYFRAKMDDRISSHGPQVEGRVQADTQPQETVTVVPVEATDGSVYQELETWESQEPEVDLQGYFAQGAPAAVVLEIDLSLAEETTQEELEVYLGEVTIHVTFSYHADNR